MSRNEDEYSYKEWQEGYDGRKNEYAENHKDWSDEQKRDHLEDMKYHKEEELLGRENAREEWGDDGDDGYDDRIEKVRDEKQLLEHDVAHADGEYEYQTERMQDMDPDLRRELEERNDEWWGYNKQVEGDRYQEDENEQEDETSDMDIISDSD